MASNRIQPGFTSVTSYTSRVGARSYSGVWIETDRDRLITTPPFEGFWEARWYRRDGSTSERFVVNIYVNENPSVSQGATATRIARDISDRIIGFPVYLVIEPDAAGRGDREPRIMWCTSGVIDPDRPFNLPDPNNPGQTIGARVTKLELRFNDERNPYDIGAITSRSVNFDINTMYSLTNWEREDSDGFTQPSRPVNLPERALRPPLDLSGVPLSDIGTDPVHITLPDVSRVTSGGPFPISIEARQYQTQVVDNQGEILVPAQESLVTTIGPGRLPDLDDEEFLVNAQFTIDGKVYTIERFIVGDLGEVIMEMVR